MNCVRTVSLFFVEVFLQGGRKEKGNSYTRSISRRARKRRESRIIRLTGDTANDKKTNHLVSDCRRGLSFDPGLLNLYSLFLQTVSPKFGGSETVDRVSS